MSAGCFAQEIGHNFGLEPVGSPHFDDPSDPGHSKDPQVIDPFAYDFVNHRTFSPYPSNRFIGDVMNNSGGGAWQGAELVMFNQYDWEHVRAELMKVGSTGTDVNPCLEDPCGPTKKILPRSPAQIHQLIGSRAGGPLWEWTPHGIRPIPSPRPGVRLSSVRNEGLLSALRDFERDGAEEIYIAVGEDPVGIAHRFHKFFTFEHPDFMIGGEHTGQRE